MRIGSVAREAGVNVQTLRYYERRGLIPRAERTASGYRRYGGEAPQMVRFIKRAQTLGFTLREIRDLLRLRASPQKDRKRVRELATAKIADIDQRMARLTAVRRSLAKLVEACECDGASLACSILDAMEDGALDGGQ